MSGSVYFSLSLPLHMLFVAVGAGFMIFSFVRRPRAYKVLLAADILLTLAAYLCHSITPRSFLAIVEIVLFAASMLLKYIKPKHKYYAKHYR